MTNPIRTLFDYDPGFLLSKLVEIVEKFLSIPQASIFPLET